MINKTSFVILRVTPDMADRIIKASKKAKKSVSKFVREVIEQYI